MAWLLFAAFDVPIETSTVLSIAALVLGVIVLRRAGAFRYKLDGTDALLFAGVLVVGAVVAVLAGLGVYSGLATLFLASGSLVGRRWLDPDRAELHYRKIPRLRVRRLARMLLIAVGGLVALGGLLWTAFIARFATATGINDLDYWVAPLGTFAGGVTAVGWGWWLGSRTGARRTRRGRNQPSAEPSEPLRNNDVDYV